MTRATAFAIVLAGLLACGWIAANGALGYRTADFQCLREGARLLATGADPYDPEAWRPLIEARFPDPFRGTAASSCVARYASPLWTAVVMLPFGILPHDVSATLWMALSIGASILGMRWIWAAARGGPGLAPVFATMVVGSQPFWLLLVGGQVTGLLLGLVGAGAWLGARGRDGLAGAALAALVIKPQVAGAYVPAMVVRDLARGRPRVLAGAAAAAALLLAVSLLLQPAWPLGWLDEVTGRRIGYAGLLPSAWGLANDVLGSALWAPVLIAAAGVAVTALVRGRPVDRLTFASLALPLSLFAMPHVWSYDFLVLALPWGVALARAGAMRGRGRTLALALVVAAATALPWALFAIGLSRGQEDWSASVPVAAALLVAILHRRSNVRIISEPST